MPTLEQESAWAAEIERDWPESRGEALGWLCRELSIDPGRLLRLLGLSREQVQEQLKAGIDWEAIASEREPMVRWITERLRGLLFLARYDRKAVAERLRNPPPEDLLVDLPLGEKLAVTTLPVDVRELVLLPLLNQGGPKANRALVAYLQPETPSERQ